MLCKVAIGRSYNASEEFAKIAALPDGYDSFVVDQDGIGNNRFSFDESEIVTNQNDRKIPENFEYIVKDSSQVR
jgi:hypothetical protein